MIDETLFPDDEVFPVLRAGEIPTEEAPQRWLIEELWGSRAVGWVAGTPKSLKTWIALEMAVSVASHTPCLNRYPVAEPGRVLLYLAEDSLTSVRERLTALARHRALDLDAVDVHVITAPTLRLDLARDQVRLLKTVRLFRARLLVLDPLVRLHRLNENAAGEVSALLSYLRHLQRELDLAVVLVHHTRKNHAPGLEGGQGLRGSGDFHAWSDSSLYLRRSRDELILSAEHRAAASPEPVSVRLVTDDEEALHLEVAGPAASGHREPSPSLETRILDALRKEVSMTRGALRAQLAVKNERLGEALARLESDGRITRHPDGWRLSESPP